MWRMKVENVRILSKKGHGKDESVLEQRYEKLRNTLAGYLLLQVDTFISGLGEKALGPAMNMFTEKSAEMKTRKIKEQGKGNGSEAVHALAGNLAESMGETFNSDYNVAKNGSVETVTLDRCGCIESIVENAETYGLTAKQARAIFCGSCMSSYRKTATSLGMGFKGRLSKEGCMMSFGSE